MSHTLKLLVTPYQIFDGKQVVTDLQQNFQKLEF